MPSLSSADWHRVCECCGKFRLFPSEASPEWLSRRNGPRAWVAFFIIAVLALVSAMNYLFSIGLFAALFSTAIGFVAGIIALLLRRWKDSPAYFQRVLLAAFIVLTPCVFGIMLSSPEALFRWRGFGLAMILPICLPSVLCLKLSFFAIGIMFYALCEMFAIYLSAVIWNDSHPLRIYVSSIAWSVASFAFARSQTILMNRVSELEDQMAYQTYANQALLSSFCDATFWLGSDADTIEDCDYRFDNLMGCAMLGKTLATNVASRGHLAADILGKGASQEEYVIVRPVTLHAAHGDIHGDLFAALPNAAKPKEPCDAVKSQGQQSKKVVYLVGIRTHTEMGTHAAPQARAPTLQRIVNQKGVDHVNDVSESIVEDADIESALVSLPRTTLTDRIFLGCSGSLREIVMLGQEEHWLVDACHIEIFPHRLLGTGGFGYVAQAQFHGVPVAMKIARNCMGDHNVLNNSMVNELRIHRRLRHPNVVQFLGAYAEFQSGNLGLIYELIDGVNLEHFVLQAIPPKYSQNRILDDIAGALRYMHDFVPILVHSDLKPANAMITQWGNKTITKLLDFGLTQRITKHASMLGGTTQWMAPEARHKKDALMTPQMDAFSFGCLSQFVMTGNPPTAPRQSKPYEPEESDYFCASCARLLLQCQDVDPRVRPCMKNVHIALRTCRNVRLQHNGEVTTNSPDDELLPCREGIASLSRHAFVTDKKLMAVKFDIYDDHIPIKEATEAWSLFHCSGESTIDSIRNVFSDRALDMVLRCLQDRINQRHKNLVPKSFGKCRTRHPDGRQYSAKLEAVLPRRPPEYDSSSSTGDAPSCIVVLSWRDVHASKIADHTGSQEVLWEVVTMMNL